MSEYDRMLDAPDAASLLRRVMDIIAGTRALPLSSSVKLDNKDEVMELLDEAMQRLPEELKAARWMLKERQEYLEKMQREGDDILAAARARAERMVQRTEIVREAQWASRRIVDEAKEESRRLRHEAEDYCDQKLASFEIILERTAKTVQAGREKLAATPAMPLEAAEATIAGVGMDDDMETAENTFFDQDRS